MGHLEGNFTAVLYIGRKVPKVNYHCNIRRRTEFIHELNDPIYDKKYHCHNTELDSSGSGLGQVAGSCEHHNEPPGSKKCEISID